MPQQTPEERRAYQLAYRAAHIEERRAYAAAYYAAHIEEKRDYDAAYNAAHPDEIHAQRAEYRAGHREEKRAYDAEYYAANAEKLCAKAAAYNAAHPEKKCAWTVKYRASHPDIGRAHVANRRARKRGNGGTVTAAQWAAIKGHYKHRCVYCHRKSQRLTQDHLTPISKGGRHEVANIVPACRSCNSRKGVGSVLTPVQPLLML